MKLCMFKEGSTINGNSLEILAIQRNIKLFISFLCPLIITHIFQHAHLSIKMFTKTYFSVLSFQDSIQCITIEETLSENTLE